MAPSDVEMERRIQQLEYNLSSLATAVADLAETVNRWARGYIDGASAGSNAQSAESKARHLR